MIGVVVSYDLEPLRCSTCCGLGYVDGTAEYLAQLMRPNSYMSGEPHTKPCHVCYGTGRHVSRARAGLAAPPTIHFDIETGGLGSSPSLLADDMKAIDKALTKMRIVDDVPEDTSEARERMRSWYETEAPIPAGAKVSTWSTQFRPGPYPDPLWAVSHAPKWWTELASKSPPNFFEIETPPTFPGGLSDEVSMKLVADLHAFGEGSNVLILGDPDEKDETS